MYPHCSMLAMDLGYLFIQSLKYHLDSFDFFKKMCLSKPNPSSTSWEAETVCLYSRSIQDAVWMDLETCWPTGLW